VWAGPLLGGKWAALLLNRGDEDATVSLNFEDLPGVLTGARQHGSTVNLQLEVTEVWGGSTFKATGNLSKLLGRHESLFVALEVPLEGPRGAS
jgi:hypothetical protein